MPNFIEDYWEKNKGLWEGKLVTRFPPEPNGYSHLGHALALFGSAHFAKKNGGVFNLRMDDTNPEKEEEHYAKSIEEMVAWLGYKWDGPVRHASDYFDKIFDLALWLVDNGHAYVDFTAKDKMREMRGTLTKPGVRSTDAEKPVEWHREHFLKMRDGEYSDGECSLRAKLDISSPNINMRDPVIYRIKRAVHARTGDKWIVYPAYMFAHPASDFFEGISLSICTLEFEDQRPFYNWTVERCAEYFGSNGRSHVPVELEFARLELDRGLTSKRKINALVEAGKVDGWDDPRLVTLAALRRRGFTPSSIRKFCEEKNVSKANSTTPFSRVEDFLRLDLDDKAVRRVVVARPILMKVEEGFDEFFVPAPNHPKMDMGERMFSVGVMWWIDSDDVRAAGTAEKGFKRVESGALFRIMHSGLVFECVEVKTDESGNITEVIAKVSPNGKPKCTIHGLSVNSAIPVDIWEVDVLADESTDPADCLTVRKGYCEPDALEVDGTFQAVRYGWIVKDRKHPERLIRAASLRGQI